MEQNSNEKDRENLSMEEYLKRRQAVKTRETASHVARGVDSVSALLTAYFIYDQNCLLNYLSTVV